MTWLVHAELLKLWTTRTARVVLALAAAGTGALTVAVLTLAAGPASRPWAGTPFASWSESPTRP
jgi:hypothetical protein